MQFFFTRFSTIDWGKGIGVEGIDVYDYVGGIAGLKGKGIGMVCSMV